MPLRTLEVILHGTNPVPGSRAPSPTTPGRAPRRPLCALSQVPSPREWGVGRHLVFSARPRRWRRELRGPPRSRHPPAGRLAGGRPFKSPGSFAWPRPLGDTAGAGGPVPPAPGSLFLSSPEPGLRSSNWDSEPGLFLALARLQEGVSSRPLRWLLCFFFNIYHLMKLFIEAAHGPCLASCPSPSFGGGGIFLSPRLDVTHKYPAGPGRRARGGGGL